MWLKDVEGHEYVDYQHPLDAVARFHRQNKSPANPQNIFPLLLGPSAVGKSTIIQELDRITRGKFVYISPFMTREARPGETDKIPITQKEFDARDKKGEFIFVNPLYGVYYGTPLEPIKYAFAEGKLPILDFPLSKLTALRRTDYEILGIYIFPPTIAQWVERMEQTGRNINGRFQAGITELSQLISSTIPHPDIDFSVINGDIQTAAHEVFSYIKHVSLWGYKDHLFAE